METLSNRALIRLILPLVAEQILVVLVSIVDALMVSGVGESAVAAVSLVDNINLFFIQLFTAMGAGGAVIAAQYLGSRERENACSAAQQLLLFTTIISLSVALLITLFHRPLVGLMDSGEDAVLFEQACSYLLITGLSYPFLGIYNGGVSLMRAMGNSKTSMITSIIMNLVNIAGNALLIHPCGLGVTGAALATLLSRAVAAFIIFFIMQKESLPIHFHSLRAPGFFRLDFSMIKRIFRLAIPNGVENSLFQGGRLLIAGLVATFPTAVRAAHGVVNSVSGFGYLPCTAIGLAAVSVIGQLIGAGKKEEALHYGKKLLRWMYLSILPTNLIFMLFATPIVSFFNLSEVGIPVAAEILFVYGAFSILSYAPSFGLPNILRAAGDARFTMTVSMASMLLFRIAASYVLVYTFDLSLMGVWLAMHMDWIIRSFFFFIRFYNKKWLHKKAI